MEDFDVCRQLEELIKLNRLPHAVIVESRNNAASEKIAKNIAKACVCSDNSNRPCGKCINCYKASQNIHPDIYTVKITDKKQAVGVGEIRTMISDCYIKPNEARGKVYLIFDKMTVEAQNALLKILEEPPPNIQFVITAETSSSLLQTILSRSTVFKLDNSLNENDNNAVNEKAKEIAVEIASAIPQNIELPLLIATGKLINDKALTQKVLEHLSGFFMAALEEKYFPENKQPQHISELSRTLKKRSLIKLLGTVEQAQKKLSQNCNMNLLATWLCANIRQSRHTS